MRPKKIRRSVRLSALYLLALLVPLSMAYSAIASIIILTVDTVEALSLGALLTTGYRAAAILAAIETGRDYFNETLTLTESRAVHAKGLLGINLRRLSIAYRDIRDIRVEQSVWGRCFGYGTLLLSTASTLHHVVRFNGAHDPFKLAEEIELRCAKARGRLQVDRAARRTGRGKSTVRPAQSPLLRAST